jgi:hypothetical protein
MRRVSASFDELVRRYYGAGARQPSTGDRMRALVDAYYGRLAAAPSPRRPRSVVLSLSFDDQETLPQGSAGRGGEYLVPAPASRQGPEEYVVPAGGGSPAVIEGTARVLSTEAVSAREEYGLDVLDPLGEPQRPAPVGVPAAPLRAAPQPEDPAVSAPLPQAGAEASRSQATDDDFIADMQSILTGQKVFDPASGRTVAKSDLGRAPSRGGDEAPARPAPDGQDTQAIFDRIARSMEYANAYDLGSLELRNRFADFDRSADSADEARQRKAGNGVTAPARSASLTVSADEVLRDLEAMQATARAQSQGSPAYSQPLYDTGEHVLTAGDLFVDRLRVGRAPGVLFSYGQIVAMADLYQSVDQLRNADPAELTRIKTLIQRSTAFHQGGRANATLAVSEGEWQAATRERYLTLAEANYEHFSPNLLLRGAGFATRHGNNKSTWETHHRLAIAEARRAAPAAGTPPFLEAALIVNAFGDHFLTDAFAAGHLINKEDVIAQFRANFYDGAALKPAGEAFFDAVARAAFRGDVQRRFEVLETYEPYILWWHPNIDSPSAFRTLLVQAARERPEQIANLAVKALHDRLNHDGVEVSNEAGETWRLTGDSSLDARNLAILRRAVQQSVDNIQDPAVRSANVDLAPFFARVWRHVPRLGGASLAQVTQLARDYTRPDSQVLRTAAADLITREVSTLVDQLKREHRLRDA